MIDQGDLLETVLRGAAAGISFLLAVVLAIHSGGARTPRLGALFSFAIGVYVLIAGEATRMLIGAMLEPAIIVAIWATVFFWWFAASLFDDNFRWRWWRVAPFILLPSSYFARQSLGVSPVSTALLYIHLGLNALLFADGLRLALMNAADDLVDPRRRFRFAFAATVAIFGIGIAIAEFTEQNERFPDALLMFQAAAILALNLFFANWMLKPRLTLFGDPLKIGEEQILVAQEPSGVHTSVNAGDRPAYNKLTELMDAGAYREEGLTVAGLATKVGVPEHHLRKLINGALGYRNFSGFLNARRIADAKLVLADPANPRKQVLNIALDLGYGSIAPFNRAFKQATGATPTEFRKRALEGQ